MSSGILLIPGLPVKLNFLDSALPFFFQPSSTFSLFVDAVAAASSFSVTSGVGFFLVCPFVFGGSGGWEALALLSLFPLPLPLPLVVLVPFALLTPLPLPRPRPRPLLIDVEG